MNKVTLAATCLTIFALTGCEQVIIDRTDRAVYSAIEKRQHDALGLRADTYLGDETGDVRASGDAYEFVPSRLDSTLPPEFRDKPDGTSNPRAPGDDTDRVEDVVSQESPVTSDAMHSENGAMDPGYEAPPQADPSAEDKLLTPEIFTDAEKEDLQVFRLRDALAYAMRHGRDLQDAKEDVYLAALDLTLERHLWTPQFEAAVRAEFADYGQVRDFDRAMTTVSEVAVSQRLPYGGTVTASIINTLMRDLGQHVTSGETGAMILDANIPLFRGAGRVAYESRYQAERDLIYAVRVYERFRRSFVVAVAAEYFSLQQSKASIRNAYSSYISRRKVWERANLIKELGQSESVFDALRAQSSMRSAEASLVSAKEQHASALDRFKITIGMPVEEPLDVVSQDEDEDSKAVERMLPEVTDERAVDIALKYRLDLLNSADSIDDRRRGVTIAKNNILPDLDFTGSVRMDTDPAQKNSLSYNSERTTWRGAVELRMDDRKEERNAYRQSLIATRRAERDFDEFEDTVRADVRRARRRVDQAQDLKLIQALNVEENILRFQAAEANFNLGRASNQDVVDAETDLLAAKNEFARAVADYRNAILQFRLDTGTLRVGDDGVWKDPGLVE